MVQPIVWENIPKSQADPTTIQEAIASTVAVHNADTIAHMADLQSIEQHRTNSIVDHPAQSILNDKIHIDDRSFVAVVGGTDPENYDTVEGGILAAVSNGGGDVRVLPGTYIMDSTVSFPYGVNLIGRDEGEVTIDASGYSGVVFSNPGWDTDEPKNQTIKNITFKNGSSILFDHSTAVAGDEATQVFEKCNFVVGLDYIRAYGNITILRDCKFTANGTYMGYFRNHFRLERCVFKGNGSLTSWGAFLRSSSTQDERVYELYDSKFLAQAGDSPNWIGSLGAIRCIWYRNLFEQIGGITTSASDQDIQANVFNFRTGNQLNLSNLSGTSVNGIVCTGNRTTGAIINTIRLGSQTNQSVVTGNVVAVGITDDGINNVVANNVIR